MSGNREHFILDVMSGRKRGFNASLLRAAMSIGEPFYKLAMSVRNFRYDHEGVHRLPKPVISVGNITAGGTGKTPVVRWLCQRLLESGHHPAVLTRGFRSADEPKMLSQFFGATDGKPNLPIAINSNRVAGGTQILADHPQTDVLIMDDGFQHRRLHRDFNLVLINAAEPFGFGHVHPRGLLREPLSGLRRADAILLTRSDAASPQTLQEIERTIATHARGTPLFHSNHKLTGIRYSTTSADQPPDAGIGILQGKRVVILCGLGDPQRFNDQITRAGATAVRSFWLGDHRTPSDAAIAELRSLDPKDADAIVTTEKDWQNLAKLNLQTLVPIWRVDMRIGFIGEDEANLLARIKQNMGNK
jgi:tetraacyldisaccharide 4'-kinase